LDEKRGTLEIWAELKIGERIFTPDRFGEGGGSTVSINDSDATRGGIRCRPKECWQGVATEWGDDQCGSEESNAARRWPFFSRILGPHSSGNVEGQTEISREGRGVGLQEIEKTWIKVSG